MTFAPGDQVGAYRIIEPLGQGGMATVYKAYHASLDRYVAIKVLHPGFKEDPNFLARFNREARIVARLDHPNIIPIFDFAEHQGTPYLVMRYVEGKTLKAIMRDSQLSLDRTLTIMRPVTAALAYAHDQNVLHRDLKPSNVMMANDGHIYLTDFGLARIAQAGDSTMSKDMLIGTPQYISPEQAQGLAVDERSDIYSLGVVLFEMLTGRVPFSADTPYAVIHDHIYSPLPLPRAINPNISPELERVLLKALDKDPRARFSSATDFMQALAQAAAIPSSSVASAVVPPPPPLAIPSSSTVSSAPTPLPSTFVRPATPAVATPAPASPVASTPVPVAKPKPSNKKGWRIAGGVVGVIALIVCILGVIFVAQRNPGGPASKNIPTPMGGLSAETQVKNARDAVNKNPNDAKAHLVLADALVAAKNLDEAFREYERAILLNPKLFQAYLSAGMTAELANDLDRALKYYQNGATQNPENVDLLLQASDVLVKLRRYDEANATLEKALKIDPGSAQAIWRLGDVDRLQGKVADALREYTRALVIDPNLPEAHYGLGQLAMTRNQKDEAIRQFQIVVNNPDAPQDLKSKSLEHLRTLGAK